MLLPVLHAGYNLVHVYPVTQEEAGFNLYIPYALYFSQSLYIVHGFRGLAAICETEQ